MQPECIHQIRPPLEHDAALFQVLGVVVGCPYLVSWCVGELALNPVGIESIGV